MEPRWRNSAKTGLSPASTTMPTNPARVARVTIWRRAIGSSAFFSATERVTAVCTATRGTLRTSTMVNRAPRAPYWSGPSSLLMTMWKMKLERPTVALAMRKTSPPPPASSPRGSRRPLSASPRLSLMTYGSNVAYGDAVELDGSCGLPKRASGRAPWLTQLRRDPG